MSTYDEIRERCIQGVQRVIPADSRASLTMKFDAAFPQVNNQVAQEYGADEDNRAILRKNVSLTFASGLTTFPESVLRKYLRDSTLLLSVTGEVASLVEPYSDYLRVRDGRLPYWTFNNLVLNAKNSARFGSGVYSGAAVLTCIASPDVPVLATDTFVAPDDYLPDFIDAMITFLVGKPASAAAAETV